MFFLTLDNCLAPHLFIEKSGAKSKECLLVIQTKSKYANDIDQQHDDDIQEPSGIDVVALHSNINNVDCSAIVCLFFL